MHGSKRLLNRKIAASIPLLVLFTIVKEREDARFK
jgi:hypothetical protein